MGLKRAVKQILIDREHRKYEIALKEKSLSYDGWIRKQEENNIIKPNICEKYRNYLTTESEKETYDGYEMENEGKSFEELEYLTLGTLRKAVQEGDVVNGTIMAGQIAGMVSKEQTCKEMIEEMMEQASALLGK